MYSVEENVAMDQFRNVLNWISKWSLTIITVIVLFTCSYFWPVTTNVVAVICFFGFIVFFWFARKSRKRK